MISFAQNFEDVMLRRVFKDKTDGFYIDVGAMDPIEHSVTKTFYDDGWRGINIEPNEIYYSKLIADRPRDINLGIAAGEREESRTFYSFGEFGTSTFDEAAKQDFAARGYQPKVISMQVRTLASICEEHVNGEIDFLKIDCEGWEKQVIEGADWKRYRPMIVLVEATRPLSTAPSWADWEPLLTQDAGYEMVYFDGLNRFYLRAESLALRSCFETPPNVFDEFVVYPVIAAQARANALEARLQVVERERQQLEAEQRAVQEDRDALQRSLIETRIWLGRVSQEISILKLQR